jgi:hypothetical protein
MISVSRQYELEKRLFFLLAIVLFVMATQAYADKKRRAPAAVPPVEINGVRYESVLSGATYGYQQDGGIVIALDAKNGSLLWSQRIYANSYSDDMESDKQDIFIKSMTPIKNGKYLLIINEHGERYELNLSTRVVKAPGN